MWSTSLRIDLKEIIEEITIGVEDTLEEGDRETIEEDMAVIEENKEVLGDNLVKTEGIEIIHTKEMIATKEGSLKGKELKKQKLISQLKRPMKEKTGTMTNPRETTEEMIEEITEITEITETTEITEIPNLMRGETTETTEITEIASHMREETTEITEIASHMREETTTANMKREAMTRTTIETTAAETTLALPATMRKKDRRTEKTELPSSGLTLKTLVQEILNSISMSRYLPNYLVDFSHQGWKKFPSDYW
jgi:hypothetical protein